jgi:Asp-tRNA(Asn)/Glu-tRNA(Gln) amidotransferase A subunit family amidase
MYIEMISNKMKEFDLDVLIQPFSITPPPAFDGPSRPRQEGNYGRNSIFSSIGFPAVIVPMGYTEEDNLPVALQIVGKPFTERKVVEAAYGYEQISKNRVPAASTPRLAGELFNY